MFKLFFAGALLTALSLGASSCRDEAAAQTTADSRGLWIGSSHITMSRSTNDLGIGYTMRSDFWFRVDADGKLKGKAYTVYQPKFEAEGLKAKIDLVKSVVGGALSMLPGGGIGVFKTVAEASKAGSNVAVSGLVGVTGEYKDPKPIRTGEITGTLRGGKLTLQWADKQPAGIPVEISLQYVNKKVPLMTRTLETQEPWHKAATVDADSGGRLAIAQEQVRSNKDDVEESLFAYWNAVRVE